MVRGARYAYAALAWAFVVGILVQVFFIGIGLFIALIRSLDPKPGAQINPGSGVLAGHLVFLAVLLVRPTGLLGRTATA